MEHLTHSHAITEYYTGLRAQTARQFDVRVAQSYAVELVERLTQHDELLEIYAPEALNDALTVPTDTHEALQHLAFMPLEQLGPQLRHMDVSPTDITKWHGKALLHIPRMTLSYLENTEHRYDVAAKPRIAQEALRPTYARMRRFAQGVLTMPDFSSEPYLFDVQRNRAVDHALIRALPWANLASHRASLEHIKHYDERLSQTHIDVALSNPNIFDTEL